MEFRRQDYFTNLSEEAWLAGAPLTLTQRLYIYVLKGV
jgi:hypothetical protein